METVSDPDLGLVREVYDEDGNLLASAAMSPWRRDGTTIYMDESWVFYATGELLPRPEDL